MTRCIRLLWSSPRTRDTQTSCRAFGSKDVTTCFYDLCLSCLWLEHSILRMRGERSKWKIYMVLFLYHKQLVGTAGILMIFSRWILFNTILNHLDGSTIIRITEKFILIVIDKVHPYHKGISFLAIFCVDREHLLTHRSSCIVIGQSILRIHAVRFKLN